MGSSSPSIQPVLWSRVGVHARLRYSCSSWDVPNAIVERFADPLSPLLASVGGTQDAPTGGGISLPRPPCARPPCTRCPSPHRAAAWGDRQRTSTSWRRWTPSADLSHVRDASATTPMFGPLGLRPDFGPCRNVKGLPFLGGSGLHRVHDLEPGPFAAGVLHAVGDDGEEHVRRSAPGSMFSIRAWTVAMVRPIASRAARSYPVGEPIWRHLAAGTPSASTSYSSSNWATRRGTRPPRGPAPRSVS